MSLLGRIFICFLLERIVEDVDDFGIQLVVWLLAEIFLERIGVVSGVANGREWMALGVQR